MTQDEVWEHKYQEVVDFIKANHRNPSKFVGEERAIRNWVKHQRKLLNGGKFKEERMEKFTRLLDLMGENKHVNQYE